MFTHLAAVALLTVGSASGAAAPPQAEAAEPVVAAAEALSQDLESAGHSNGRLPAEILVEIESSDGCLLELQAGEQWMALEQHAAADGIQLVARWCYRNLSTQQRTYDRNCPLTPAGSTDPGVAVGTDEQATVQLMRKCRVATAKPGNSNHGWGRAIDIKEASRLLGCESSSFLWLSENAYQYGWVHPEWAGCGAPKEEPWHWEWAGLPEPVEPQWVPPPAGARDLARWLAELEGYGYTAAPTDIRPNWIKAFLQDAAAA